MSKLFFPTGISVEQAKKDAKILSNKTQMKLSKAQDVLSGIHARMPWAKAINLINNVKEASFTLHDQQNKEINFTLNAKKSLTFIYGNPGCGKGTLLNTMVDQFLQNQKVTYLTVETSIDPSTVKYLQKKYGNKINVIYFHVDFITKEVSIDLDDIELNGSILVIDEYARLDMAFSKGNDYLKIKRLVDASIHTIISTQLADSLYSIGNVFSSFSERCVKFINCPYATKRFFKLRWFPYFKGRYDEIMKDNYLLTLNNKYVDFTLTDSDSTKIIRLLVKNAIIKNNY